MPAPYTGGCQCGSVRYVLTAEPIRVTACHCTECQRQSGGAFGMSMPVRKEGLSVTGSTKQFTRIADSGGEVTGVFCPDCGVRIYHVLTSAPDVLSLKPGTLDDTSWLRPTAFIWMNSAQSWVPVPDGVKALDGQTQRAVLYKSHDFTETAAGRDYALGMQALKRLVEPDDIGGVVAFHASDEARGISGGTIHVDDSSKL